MLKQVSTSNVSDAMHRRGEMSGLMQVSNVKKFFGKAFTVRAYPGDWSKTVQAIDAAERGDVIVIDAHESRVALWGALATMSAISRGIAGLVIDGAVRDIEEIKRLASPYSRAMSARLQGSQRAWASFPCPLSALEPRSTQMIIYWRTKTVLS